MVKANRYVQYFISHPDNNGIKEIAEYFGVHKIIVSKAVDKYYKDKMDAKNNVKRISSKHCQEDSGVTQI